MRTILALFLACAAWGASPLYVKTVCSAENDYYTSSLACTGTVANSGDLLTVDIGNGSSTGSEVLVSAVSEGANGFLSSNVSCTDPTYHHFEQWKGYASASGSRTITVAWVVATTWKVMIVKEYIGAATTGVLDAGASAHNCTYGSGSGVIDFGGVITTGVNELISCGVFNNNPSGFTAGTGFGNLVSFGTGISLASEDRPAATSTGYGTTMSKTSPAIWVGGCASYNSLPVSGSRRLIVAN
jgi:hypothetical protein